MRGAVLELARRLAYAAFGAVMLSVFELSFALGPGRELFLSDAERWRFAATSLAVSSSIAVMISVFASFALELLAARASEASPLPRRAGRLFAACAWPFLSWALVALSEGRRVRGVPGRLALCVVLSAVVALALGRGLSYLMRVVDAPDRRARIVHAICLGAWSFVAVALDALVLRGLYPAWHASLAVAAAVLALAAAWVAPPVRVPPTAALAAGTLVLVLAFLAPFSVGSLAHAPNARFAAQQAGPLTGKLVRLFGAEAALSSAVAVPSVGQPAPRASRPGIDLRGQDILLVTIDALRADRLRAYGGRGLTPELDALAARSCVFEHAYTPTPHTSYALGSLLTGKYLRPVLSLPNAPREHATLPRMLRRFGYRTAGFYPPAVFFVDQERFASLHEDRFGLEYTKEMFAPAEDRVRQVERYLEAAPREHPVFVWVHVFEPHEPYDPPPAFRRGDSPVELYDAEVAAADAAVGALVRSFRERRPSSTVIVTADHGEEFGDHGGYHHGTSLYEEQVHVPLIWSSAGHELPQRISAPVELIDLATTLLSALGVPRDARMRGDDLGALLAGAPASEAESLRAFASIDELRMLSDGRSKVMCDAHSGSCRGFDLLSDPGERRPLDPEDRRLLILRSQLSDLVASLPQAEALAMQGGGGWPSALSRARLGDPAVGPELLPLLGSARPEVRAEALRALARLRYVEARTVVAGLRDHDSEPGVRDEAAVCALELALPDAAPRVQELLRRPAATAGPALDLERRAAAALARAGYADGTKVLLAHARDANAEETERAQALSLIGMLHSSAAVEPLIELLSDVRMRAAVVRSLAAIGGQPAANAIAQALREERYPEFREVEVAALVRLQDGRATALLLRMMGTPAGVPNGVKLMSDLGYLKRASAVGADLREPPNSSAQQGEWACDAHGCLPGKGASLAGPFTRAPMRIVLRVAATGTGQWISLDGEMHEVAEGESELSLLLPAATTGAPRKLGIASSAGLRLIAFVIAKPQDDIAPPAPEPYDAGVDSATAESL